MKVSAVSVLLSCAALQLVAAVQDATRQHAAHKHEPKRRHHEQHGSKHDKEEGSRQHLMRHEPKKDEHALLENEPPLTPGSDLGGRLASNSGSADQLKNGDSENNLMEVREGEDASRAAGGAETLRFLHIPKTGGQSIEEAASDQGIFWGHRDTNIPKFGKCSPWHTPPSASHELADYYAAAGVKTFCVVRDPVERLLSQYVYDSTEYLQNPLLCSESAYADWVEESLRDAAQNPDTQDCHLYPQASYVFDSDGKQVCNIVLWYPDLKEEFGSLMKEYDLGVTLAKSDNVPKQECDLTLPAELNEKVHQFFEDDYAMIEKGVIFGHFRATLG